jgi:drug/metabolite transporter (DMT)-like permease
VLAVGLALLASACWGVADFVGGLSSRRVSAVLVLLAQQAVGLAIAAAVVVATGTDLPSQRAILLSMAAGAAGALALGAFYRALAVGTMSVVAPISASGATLPVAVGLATGDRPTSIQALGLVLTVAGVVLASREIHEGQAPAGARLSIVLALLSALGFGLFFSLSDPVADESVLWLLVIARSTAVVLLVGIVATRGAGLGGLSVLADLPRRTKLMLLLCGTLDLAATGLYGLANTHGALSIVAVVGSLYPVVTVLLARGLLGERLRAVQTAGVALAFAGVAAVVAGATT